MTDAHAAKVAVACGGLCGAYGKAPHDKQAVAAGLRDILQSLSTFAEAHAIDVPRGVQLQSSERALAVPRSRRPPAALSSSGDDGPFIGLTLLREAREARG